MKSWDIKKNIVNEKLRVGIVLPYFNEDLGMELLQNATKELKKAKVKSITISRVFGALEIPYACLKMMKKVDVIIALGIVIKGGTKHFDLVVENTYAGIMQTQIQEKKPIIFGILTCDTKKQAIERVSEKKLNKGKEFATAALIQSLI